MICMIYLTLPSGSRVVCMIWHTFPEFGSCRVQILHKYLITAGEDLSDVSDVSDLSDLSEVWKG